MTRLLVCALCAVALVGCGSDDDTDEATSEPPAWNHDPDDAELGPEAWGDIDRAFETCRTGLNQSPVDISEAVDADLPPLELDYPEAPLVIENTGHTIEVPMPEDGGQTLTIGADEFRLIQYHFHAPSEHTLDGGSSDAEVHLVHQSDDGGLAVVSFLLDAGTESSPLVDLVLESAPEEAGEEAEVEEERSPLEILNPPAGATDMVVHGYWTYSGSLTTPGCTEGVRWIVFGAPLEIAQSSIERLHELVADFPEYDGYENNNRPTQPLNDRQIQTQSSD